jgi:hypothetical protein
MMHGITPIDETNSQVLGVGRAGIIKSQSSMEWARRGTQDIQSTTR